MKNVRSLTPSHAHGMGSRAADRIGMQIAAALLAVMVTPSTPPTRDAHAHTAPAVDRTGAPGTRG